MLEDLEGFSINGVVATSACTPATVMLGELGKVGTYGIALQDLLRHDERSPVGDISKKYYS